MAAGAAEPLCGQTLYSCALLHGVRSDTHSWALLHSLQSVGDVHTFAG